jgi:hypothetical protein
MKVTTRLAPVMSVMSVLASTAAWCQTPTTGPGVQSLNDSREPEVLKTCKTPPPARGGRGPGRGPGAAPPAAAGPRDYKVTEIAGVVAAGQQWKEIWQVDGNNADGIIGTKDGGLLIAQNDKSNIVRLDKNGKASIAYMGTNTAAAQNSRQ